MSALRPPRKSEPARPFPWSAKEKWTRADAAAARALHRWSDAFVRAEAVGGVVATLLDARVDVRLRRVRRRESVPGGTNDGIAVLLASGEETDLADAALLEIEPALGVALVARALRRSPPKVLAYRSSGEGLAGAVAAIAAATARRLPGARTLRVIGAGPVRDLEAKLASAGVDLIEASISVRLNDEAFDARALVPLAAALAAPEPPWTRAALATLGDIPIALPLVAAVSESTAGEIGTLRRGDAWLPASWTVHLAPSGSLEGYVFLASPELETGIRAELGEGGRLVVREALEPMAWTPASRATNGSFGRQRQQEEEAGVSDAKDPERDALVEAVGEVPVVVRVEIGVAETRAREWASLAPGDVVALGRKLGDSVTLRVGGVTVARGELVDLEGEIAVRILGRIDGEGASGPGRAMAQEK